MTKKFIIKNFYKLFISILLISTFFWWYWFLQTTKANNIDINNLIKGIDAVDTVKNTDKDNFGNMINFFCEAMKNQTIDWSLPQESIFLYNICKYKDKIDFFKIEWFGDDEKKSYIKFKEDVDGNPVNQLTKWLPDFYKETEGFIQELFDKIIGSYISIYQANIYWYINDPKKSDFTQHFSKQYFSYWPNTFIDICATDKHYGYPKTCKKLKEYFYAARNIINSNADNILNDENIYKAYENWQKNTITNWLYWGNIDSFINLIYNELMYYGLFVEYYSYLLQNKSEFKNRNVKNFNDKIANNQNRIWEMYDNIESSRKAIQTSIKILKEIQYTFPIHIWFLMYSEDIYKFVWNMNKTLTPIYTLQDIFRNVQKPD